MEKKKSMGNFPLAIIIILASIGIGSICTTVITSLSGGWNITVMRYLIWMCASVIYGLTAFLIFCKDRFNLPAAVGLHCLISMGVTFAAYKLCRFGDDSSVLAGVLIIFLIIYAVIFTCIYLTLRAEAKKVNDMISRK